MMSPPQDKNQSPQKDMNIQNLSVREADTEDNLKKDNPTIVKGGSHSGAQEGNDKSITQRVQTITEDNLKKEIKNSNKRLKKFEKENNWNRYQAELIRNNWRKDNLRCYSK